MYSMLKETNMKGPNSHYDEVEMRPHSECLPKSEPQYEVCGGGVTSNVVAMEENPAYQSVDIAATRP